MKLVFKPYLKRDGTAMIYINNDRKVSVGVSADQGFGQAKPRATESIWDRPV